MKNKEELTNIIRLAKLSAESEDAEALFNEIVDTVSIVQSVNDVDLSEYDCSDEVMISSLREDEVMESTPVDMILSNAAEVEDNFFIV